MPDASDASADASAAYPRPCARPGLPGDDAREIESRRAVRAKARGESLAASDVPVLRRDDADADADGDGGGAFVVVRKPAGVYVDDVLAALERDASASASASPSPSPRRLHLAHRLDRDTSGCLVVATSTRACAALTRAFADGKVRKEYLAHCSSAAASSSSEPREPDPSPSPSLDGARPLTLRTGHGRSRNGLWRVYPLSDVGRALPRDPGRKTTLVKIAETSLVVVATAAARGGGGGGERSRCAYVRATPTTGRTHQIRLHCAHAGAAIVGDVKYGGPRVVEEEEEEEEKEKETQEDDALIDTRFDGFRLHAAKIAFPHPTREGQTVEVECPPPGWWREAGESVRIQ